MKSFYIKDVFTSVNDQRVELLGWVVAKRNHGKVVFFDLTDSTAGIQIIVKGESNESLLSIVQQIRPESAVRVVGIIARLENSIEILAESIEIIGGVSTDLETSPRPRMQFDIFSKSYTDLVLRKRHLYLRNPHLMAILRFRYKFLQIIHEWFGGNGFIEIQTPVLSRVALYEDSSVFKVSYYGEEVFLNQCSAFYLESAVHAFEKVYNISPSFRAEESKSPRHLAEYWHLKGEIAFAGLEDIIVFTETTISEFVRQIALKCREELNCLGIELNAESLRVVPYPRLTYREAFEQLQKAGLEPEWLSSFSDKELSLLSNEFNSPFWIIGQPRKIEPFPYELSETDSEFTKTADLIAPEGFGELLGVAEKIFQPEPLLQRMREKGRENDSRYDWYAELREFGSVPHSGFGMGIERFLRWILRLNHVRDAIAFPRLSGRSIYP